MNRISTKELDRILSMIDKGLPCTIIREDFFAVLRELKELRTLCEKQSQLITTQTMYIERYIDGRD